MIDLNLKILRKININEDQDIFYPDNGIKTAKYNLISFLPFALFNQFNNYFNIFFLITAIILSIPIISPVDQGSAIGPFIFVLSISLIREAIEDTKKAKYDKTYNESLSLEFDFLTDSFSEIKWKDISVGKIVKVLKNEVIPADLLIVKSSLENGFCYLQTTNLDGESALKPRETMPIFHDLIKIESDLKNLVGDIEIDPPDDNIYKVEGSVKITDLQKSYFDINNILLRGGTLKNVEYIYGIVVYTGKETKIMKNIKNGYIKQSSIDLNLNKIVIFIICLTFFICMLCTLFGMLFWNQNKPSGNDLNMDYIFFTNTDNGIVLEIFKTFAGFFTIFNTLIPISVMIILEVVKSLQIFFLQRDALYKVDKGDKFKILSLKLQEDLGAIKYIFTDKTGTLTRNEMEFKACSIFTKLFDDEKIDNYLNMSSSNKALEIEDLNKSHNIKQKSIFSEKFDYEILKKSLLIDHPIDILDIGNTPFYSMKEAALEFFLNIAINHNVLTEIDKKKEKTYTGSNPDEVVLVQAAKELGIEFIERSNKYIKIKVLEKEFSYKILHRFEYSSERMRSSIIIQDPFNRIKLYMKGADSIILKKINTYSKNFVYDLTKEHLDKFAKTGLRTLCYSMKILDQETYSNWDYEYKLIQDKALKDKSYSYLLEESISRLEDDMLLVGVTGLEDKLQDDVRDCLQDFIEAGINVWMLTGDKLDTAESIGYSCKLFNDDTEVFKIKAGNEKLITLNRVKEIFETMVNIEKELLEFKIEKKRKKRRGEKITGPHNKFSSERLILDKNRYDKLKLTNFEKQVNAFPANKVINHSYSISNKHSNYFQKTKAIRLDAPEILHMKKNNDRPKNTQLNRLMTDNKLNRTHNNRIGNEGGNYLDINELNNQIKNEKIKFIGSQVDNKSNLITLNFMKQNSDNSKNTIDLKENKQKLRPVSSNYLPIKRRNFDLQNAGTKKQEFFIPSDNNEESFAEDDDVDIIRFMIDKNFFEDNQFNLNKGNFTFLNDLLAKQPTIMNRDEPAVPSQFNLPAEIIEQNKIIRNMDNDNNFDYFKMQMDENESYNRRKFISSGQTRHGPGCRIQNPLNDSNEKDNFDFGNIYDHYQSKIKTLKNHNNYNLLNFNFDKNKEDETNNKNLSMKNFGLIVEGAAISQCLEPDIAPIFWECLRKSSSVICCRCAPIQKSEVVNFVKNKSGETTLAIGDGGNDVNMIKVANVGVGIFGKEGYQAAFNADYAVGQFKYLRRLLFVHGRYSLLRNSYFINFFFYKNLLFTFPQFWFSFFNGFSGALLWDDWYTLGFNSFMTTVPAGIRMLHEEDIDISFTDYPDKKLME